MKKIFLFLASACALASCDPVSEDISNAGHMSKEEIRSKSEVSLDVASDGRNGNVVSCFTSAPVVAKWDIRGKQFIGNFATKKMSGADVGVKRTVVMTYLCPDGTTDTIEYTVQVDTLTNPLKKFWIYGEDPVAEPAFTAPNWDSNYMRFSDNEGKRFKFLSDEIYWGFKTLIFDLAEGSDATVKVMSGWWSNVNVDDQHWVAGSNELPLTEDIAKVCAKGNGGTGQDLTLMVTGGTATVKSVYYEE